MITKKFDRLQELGPFIAVIAVVLTTCIMMAIILCRPRDKPTGQETVAGAASSYHPRNLNTTATQAKAAAELKSKGADNEVKVIELDDGMLVEVKPIGYKKKGDGVQDIPEKSAHTIPTEKELRERFLSLKAAITEEIEELAAMAAVLEEQGSTVDTKNTASSTLATSTTTTEPPNERVVKVKNEGYVQPDEFDELLRKFGVGKMRRQ